MEFPLCWDGYEINMLISELTEFIIQQVHML